MFAAPLWLWALLAVGIPLALHLWSRRPHTVIRVSSVRHLQGLPTARRWSRKLTEPLLLLLRLAVVTLLALALARPRLAGLPEGKGSPVVLLDPRLLKDSVALGNDPLLDSLRQAGARVRLLSTGLPATPIAKPAFWYPEGRATMWDLIAQADRTLSPDKGLLVIARPSPEALGGVRPRVGVPVRWHVPASSRPTGWWIGEARRTEEGIRVWLFHGDEGHVCSRQVTLPAEPRAVSHEPWGVDIPRLEVDSTLTRVRLLSADSRQPIADSLPPCLSPSSPPPKPPNGIAAPRRPGFPLAPSWTPRGEPRRWCSRAGSPNGWVAVC
jgi:hypothetical protein